MALPLLELRGTAREMGRQHGEALRDWAQAMCHTRLRLAALRAEALTPPRDLAWCLELATGCVAPVAEYSPAVYEEWAGMAEAAGLTLPQMVIGNGWTDFADLIRCRGGETPPECTSLILTGERTAQGRTYLAQTWDMSPSARPYLVLVRRQPTAGPRTLALTTAGCLSLIGLNEAGIAVGNTNLAPADPRPGVHYLALIHHALAQTTLDQAMEAIAAAPRLSGHYYYLGGPTGAALGLETTGTRHALLRPSHGALVHTNHYQTTELLATGLPLQASANSLARQARLEQLVAQCKRVDGPGEIQEMLSDHRGEEPLCRHTEDPANWASLAAVVLAPEARALYVRAGNPCTGPAEKYPI